MTPETVLAAIKSSSQSNWLGYFFKLSALTHDLNSQGQPASQTEVAVGLDFLTKSGCKLTIIDDVSGTGLDYWPYQGDLKSLLERDFQLWLIPPKRTN